MPFRIRAQWKVFCTYTGVEPGPFPAPPLFNRQRGGGFARSLGGDFRLHTMPVVLSPTNHFHRTLRSSLGLTGESRFPYLMVLDGLDQQVQVNLNFHLHGTRLCTTVGLSEFEVEDVASLADLQELRKNKSLWRLVSKAIGMACSGRGDGELRTPPKTYPLIQIRALSHDPDGWESRLASIVTRHVDLEDRIVRDVLGKNADHQIDQTRILVDRQGMAAYVPIGVSKQSLDSNQRRFEQAAAMIQLAAVCKHQISEGTLSQDLIKAIREPDLTVAASVSGRLVWKLLIKEFTLEKLMAEHETEVERGALHEKSDVAPASEVVLLVTVTQIESRALRSALEQVIGSPSRMVTIDNYPYRHYGFLGRFDIYHQISGMGSGGIAGSQESIRHGIVKLQPKFAVMVGIAFGMDDPSKQPVGTVLVSRQLQSYELQRVNSSGETILRGDKVSASRRVQAWIDVALSEWDDGDGKVEPGLMISGEKLIDNGALKAGLKNKAPEAIGGEMEGAGMYAACQSQRIDWVVIKAVCDWADGNKGENKDVNQQIAAEAAAKFAAHVLEVAGKSESR